MLLFTAARFNQALPLCCVFGCLWFAIKKKSCSRRRRRGSYKIGWANWQLRFGTSSLLFSSLPKNIKKQRQVVIRHLLYNSCTRTHVTHLLGRTKHLRPCRWLNGRRALLCMRCCQICTCFHQVMSPMLRTWTVSPVTKAASNVNAVSRWHLSPICFSFPASFKPGRQSACGYKT